MSNSKASVKQSDLARCLKAHRDAGIPIDRTEIDLSAGKIVIFTNSSGKDGPNDWDEK